MIFLPRHSPLPPLLVESECQGQGANQGWSWWNSQETTPVPSTAIVLLHFYVLSFFPMLNSFSGTKESGTVLSKTRLLDRNSPKGGSVKGIGKDTQSDKSRHLQSPESSLNKPPC